MTEALLLTFQSQLSVVMETVLKTAMFEITRLVEDSFLEEVGHHKQEVEVLKLRLQLSESKLREKERERELERERDRERERRRTKCPDCGRTGDSSSQPTEAPRGTETLCLGVSLRVQPAIHPQESNGVLSTRQHLESTKQSTTVLSKDQGSSQRHTTKEIVTVNSPAQVPQDFLQRLLGSSAIHNQSTGDFNVTNVNRSENDFILDKKIDSEPSKQSQTASDLDACQDLPSSSPDERVKSETVLDLQHVKEEEEMVPVWESINRDDGFHAEMSDLSQPELRGSCDQEEIQVDSFPGLNSLDMADATSYFANYSVNTVLHQGIRAQHSNISSTELPLSNVPESAHSYVQESRQSYPGSESSVCYSQNVVCASEKRVSHAKYPKRSSQAKHGKPDQVQAERISQCPGCGKKFLRLCDFKVHLLTHKGKKPLSCSQCNEKFQYNFELKVHLRNHSGERPHVCPYCGKAFSRMSNFKQHQNIHTREKLFSCFQCGMRFNRATNLRVHLRRHSHASMAYNCPHCTKTFLNLRQKKSHLLKAHGSGGGGGK